MAAWNRTAVGLIRTDYLARSSAIGGSEDFRSCQAQRRASSCSTIPELGWGRYGRPVRRSVFQKEITRAFNDFPTPSQRMKTLPRLLILVATSAFFLVGPRADARTMLDLPGFPVAGLHVYLPAEAYSRLVNAPVKAYIQLRGQIANSKVTGSRVIHSEGGGVYDKASVQIANGMQLYTDVTASRLPPSVLVHVVIYQLPKGEHAIALAQDDTLGASNFVYSRSLRMVYLGLANQKQPAAPQTKKK